MLYPTTHSAPAGSDDDSEVSYDSADDSSSIYQPPRRSGDIIIMNEDVDLDESSGEGTSFDLQPSTSQMYQDEDEESEDEEGEDSIVSTWLLLGADHTRN